MFENPENESANMLIQQQHVMLRTAFATLKPTEHALEAGINQQYLLRASQRFAKCSLLVTHNMLVVMRAGFDTAKRKAAIERPLEPLTFHDYSLNFASNLIDLRGQAFGVAIEDRSSQVMGWLVEAAGVFEEVRSGFIKQLPQAFRETGEGAVAFEAVQCCALACLLDLEAPEIWPVPPELWKPVRTQLVSE